MNDQERVPEILASDIERVGKITFFGLVAIAIAVVPFLVSKQFFFPFIVPRTGFFMIVVDLLVVNWAVLHFINPKEYRLPLKNPIIWGAVGMLAVWTISGLLGADWTLSFWSTYQRMTGILLLLHLTAFVLVVPAVIRREKIWQRLMELFTLTGVAVSAYTIFGPHGFSVFTGLDLSRGGATIGNTSFLGTFVLFTIFVGLIVTLHYYQKHKRVKWWHIIGLVIMLGSPAFINYEVLLGEVSFAEVLNSPFVLLGQARAVVGSLLLGLILALGLYLLRTKSTWKKTVGGVLSFGTIAATGYALVQLMTPGTLIQEKFGELAARARFLTWNEAMMAFKERPLLGWGPESFDLLHQRFFDPLLYAPGYGGELWFDRAHNIVVDTMVSTGILGVLAYMGVFAGLFYVVYRLRKMGRVSNVESALLGGLMFAYIVQGMTVFDMTVSYFAFFLVLAYVAAKLPRSERNVILRLEDKEGGWKAFHAIVATVAVIAIFATSVRVMNASWSVSRSLIVTNPNERLELYEAAFAFPAGRTLYLRTVSNRMYDTLRQNPQLINPQSSPIIQAEAQFFEEGLAYEGQQRPYNYRAWVSAAKMAQLQVFLGRTAKIEDAIRYSNEAIAVAPQNPMAYLTLSELYMMSGQFDEAENALETMLSVAPESPFIQNAYDLSIETVNALREGRTPEQPAQPITL